ncbi:MAG: HEAT repeat domain-containing protein [Bdellovibrionota bacterium]
MASSPSKSVTAFALAVSWGAALATLAPYVATASPTHGIEQSPPIASLGSEAEAEKDFAETLRAIERSVFGGSVAKRQFARAAAHPDELLQTFHNAIEQTNELLALQLSFQFRDGEESLAARAAQEVAKLLPQGTTSQKLLAVESLGLIGSSHAEAVEALQNALRESNDRIRYRAVVAFSRLKNPPPSVREALQASTRDTTKAISERAQAALGEPSRLPSQPPDKASQRSLLAAAPPVAPPSRPGADRPEPKVLEKLRSQDSRTRAEAAMAVATQLNPSEETISALAANLNDSDERARFAASYALGQIGVGAVPVLLRELRSEQPQVRLKAVQALKLVQPTTDEIVGALEKSLGDEDSTVRLQACVALLALRPNSDEAVDTLIHTLGMDYSAVAAVSPSLRKIDAGAAKAKIRQSLSAADPVVRRGAVRSLEALGASSAEAGDDLRKLLSDPDESVRKNAERALAAAESHG